MSLNITVLLENKNRHPQLDGGVGLSLLLDDGEQRILFDTGQDQRFCDNAHRLGIDLGTLTRVVLSHGHYDHFGGLPYLIPHTPYKPEVICHPDVFLTRYAGKFVGSRAIRLKKISPENSETALKTHFPFRLSRHPVSIGSRFIFAGEIERSNKHKSFGLIENEDGFTTDYVKDDSCLIWQGSQGLIIIVGCSHSGICDIIRYAKHITGIDKVSAVIGGLHLRSAGIREMLSTRRYFQAQNIDLIYGCHCTGAWGRLWLPNAQPLNTGDSLSLE
ncbi:MBL fold metallo-hydrolase [Hafnia paralvei]|uniref:MBL fold metallo-hydrolase n=1 Tax=Hafnia paralvei TaxID=546367 RepID=UPI001CCED416|nr:MBL fold metallo-hydrolase [Hafnia paralvei]UBM42418.1 MBL fold metallo-hydrolase [Hafnia paralvei]